MSGVKGRSGRKPHYDELNTNELLMLAESSLRKYFKDPNIDLQHKASLAALLYSKAIKTQTENTIKLMPSYDIAMLNKYDIALPNNRLDMITGNTASGVDNTTTNNNGEEK
jgi:hypothetical protein